MTGNCEGGYSCAYINTLSWRTGTLPLPMETNPRVVFERLFGEPGDQAARQAQRQIDRSILDGVSEDLARLHAGLAPTDRRTVNEYLDVVRDVEHRIQQTEKRAADAPEIEKDAPLGDGDLHVPHNVPVALVGGGGGQLRAGRRVKVKFDTPFMNLGLSPLDKVGAGADPNAAELHVENKRGFTPLQIANGEEEGRGATNATRSRRKR